MGMLRIRSTVMISEMYFRNRTYRSRSEYLNDQFYKNAIGIVIKKDFYLGCLVKFRDSEKCPTRWINDKYLYCIDEPCKKEKFILSHTNTDYCVINSLLLPTHCFIKFENNLNEVIEFIGTCNDYYESSISGFFTPVPAFMIDDIDKNKTKLTVYLRLLTKTVNITEDDFVVFNFETLDLSVYPEKTFYTLFTPYDKDTKFNTKEEDIEWLNKNSR